MNIVDQQKLGDYVLITLQGEILNLDVGLLTGSIKNLIKYRRNIIIDFEECERIHTSAIAFLLNINQALSKHKLQLFLCHPPYDFQFVLQLLGLEHHLHIILELDDLLHEQDFKDALPLNAVPLDQLSEENIAPQEKISPKNSARNQSTNYPSVDDGLDSTPTIYNIPDNH